MAEHDAAERRTKLEWDIVHAPGYHEAAAIALREFDAAQSALAEARVSEAAEAEAFRDEQAANTELRRELAESQAEMTQLKEKMMDMMTLNMFFLYEPCSLSVVATGEDMGTACRVLAQCPMAHVDSCPVTAVAAAITEARTQGALDERAARITQHLDDGGQK